MTARDLFAFAVGALAGHRLRTALSLAGVAIGVVSVVLLTSLGEGARLYVAGEFSALGANLVIVMPGKSDTTGVAPMVMGVAHDLTLDDVEALRRRVTGAVRVAPLAAGVASVQYADRSRDSVVTGTTAEWRVMRNVQLSSGQYLPEGDGSARAVCVLGATVARELFHEANPLGESVRIGGERYRVIGVAAARGQSLGMNLDEVVQVPVLRAMQLFNLSSASRVLIEGRSAESVATLKADALAVLRERHGGQEDVTVLTQDSIMATFGTILTTLTEVLAGIAAISLTVAGIGIMNVMLVAVSERVREIGLLKALGATEPQVLRVFLTEAAVLTTLGGLAGLALASVAIAALRWMYPSFPTQAPWWAVVGAILVSLAVGLAFGALPARRASRLDPVIALAKR
jgi:putative ABC transport system permease protein